MLMFNMHINFKLVRFLFMFLPFVFLVQGQNTCQLHNTKNLVHTNPHAFETYVQTDHFCKCHFNYPPWEIVKTTCNHTFNYIMNFSCNSNCITNLLSFIDSYRFILNLVFIGSYKNCMNFMLWLIWTIFICIQYLLYSDRWNIAFG